MKSNFFSRALCTLLATTFVFPVTSVKAEDTAGVSRPPQYVLLAWDGSGDVDFWKQTLREAEKSGARYTYFVSGVYYLKTAAKNLYEHPTHGKGKSNIGFGGTADKVRRRIDVTNESARLGHEIASHVNAHFEGGSKWSAQNWRDEFSEFYKLIFKAWTNNGFAGVVDAVSENPFSFTPESIVGFRAPYLEGNAAMYSVLNEYHYRYDTSDASPAVTRWPAKRTGVWRFPLQSMKIVGTAKNTLSMDYNFYEAQSRGREDLKNADVYGEQMLQTYREYFRKSFVGNRAPIHIGHHFTRYNGGTYARAFFRFAREVCGLPEVQCITNRDLADRLDQTPKATLAAYQAGRFPRWNGDFSKLFEAAIPNPVGEIMKRDDAITEIPAPETSAVTVLDTAVETAAPTRAPIEVHAEFPLLDTKSALLPPSITATVPASGRAIEAELVVETPKGLKTRAQLVGPDAARIEAAGALFFWSYNGQRIGPAVPTLELKYIYPKLPTRRRSELSVSVRVNGKEIARATHTIRRDPNRARTVRLSMRSIESRATIGDLPEAHAEILPSAVSENERISSAPEMALETQSGAESSRFLPSEEAALHEEMPVAAE